MPSLLVLHIISLHLAVYFIVIPSSSSWNSAHSVSSASFLSLNSSGAFTLLYYQPTNRPIDNFFKINQSAENYTLKIIYKSLSLVYFLMPEYELRWSVDLQLIHVRCKCVIHLLSKEFAWYSGLSFTGNMSQKYCNLRITCSHNHAHFTTMTWHNYEYFICNISTRNMILTAILCWRGFNWILCPLLHIVLNASLIDIYELL